MSGAGWCVKAMLGVVLSAGMPNYFHYIKAGSLANYDEKEDVAEGVEVFRWAGTDEGVEDMQKGVCAHTIIEWDSGVTTPYPSSDSVHSTPTTFFVSKGNVTVTVGSETKVMKTGDTLWVNTGVTYSSLVPTDAVDDATIVVALKEVFDPAPASLASAVEGSDYRFYMASEDLKPPVIANIRQNSHYEWYGTGSQPDVLHVWWGYNSQMPCHSHAEGALYVTGWGSMCFAGETDGDSCIGPGEARWTKPGYEYSNEASGDAGAEIVVMNIASNPSQCRDEDLLELV